MIGFLRPHGPSPAARALYRATQCSLCHQIGATYGFRYRALAGPDLVLYNVWLDALGESEPAMRRRPCVVTPWGRPLPVLDATRNTRQAAAVGVWMAVEKLRDDLADEGGLHRWLAVRAMARGQRRAESILRELDFPIDEIRSWMNAQRAVEEQPTSTLEVASAPTRGIAALVYGSTDPARGRALGERLGSWLFWVDNLLDRGRDAARGHYNALSRAPQPPTRAQVVERAWQDIDGLRDALDEAGITGPRGELLRSAMLRGTRDRVRRLAALSDPALEVAKLPDILPPRRTVVDRARQALQRVLRVAPLRARVALSMLIAWLLPHAAWAERWWPEDVRTLELDGPATPPEGGTPPPDACDSCCEDWCDDMCDSSCDGLCDEGACLTYGASP